MKKFTRKKTIVIIMIVGTFFGCNLGEEIVMVDRPDTGKANDYYTGNRPPLVQDSFIKLPVGSIKPQGWLKKQLELQADGFHGHLPEISRYLNKEGNAWLSPDGRGERGWEEEPYWLKGFSNCGYILGNERMIKESRIWIEGALNSRQSDGWFGPAYRKGGSATKLKGRTDLWPNMIMLFCLQDYYEFTGSKDKRVIDLMTGYFRYLSAIPDEDFLVGYWPRIRGGDMLYSVIWLYNRTGEDWLLDFACKVHRNTANWEQDVINWHNVNISQGFGEPATFYLVSKDSAHLTAADRNWQKVRDLYGQVPGGMFGGDENCRPGYTGPRQAVETCGMVEMMFSHEILMMISGDTKWADRCEDVTFNSFPASMTADLKALRYLTAPNLVQSDRQSKAPGLQNSGPMLLMDPHRHRCCQHNVGQGWPYYAEHLWAATRDNGLAVLLYSASEVNATVGNGTSVTIKENTHYPFEEQIEFVVSLPNQVSFPLYLRVPGWCDKPELEINGKLEKIPARQGLYILIKRIWSNGDKVNLKLNMNIRLTKWTKNKNSVSVSRGPLSYSLKIGEKYVRQGGSDKWPAWEIYPTTDWNYGLVLEGENLAAQFEFVQRSWPENNQPFVTDAAPVEIMAKARKIPEWQQDSLGLVGILQQSPVRTDELIETVTLIPMGCARLRISSFPTVTKDSTGHQWSMPSGR